MNVNADVGTMTERERIASELRAVTTLLETATLPASAAPLLSLRLTVQQLKVLTLLVTGDGAATGRGLAVTCGVSEAAMSGLLDRLTTLGAVERLEDPSDHRVRRVTATPLGRSVVRDIVSARPEFRDDVLEGLSLAELRGLLRGMTGIARQVAALGQAPPPSPGLASAGRTPV